MARYRKRPVEIEAVQWNGGNRDDFATLKYEGLGLAEEDDRLVYLEGVAGCPASLLVKTTEEKICAPAEWWIIKGVEGELYPCKDSIFQQTYEPV